jgi:UDP-glucose 4-epimerase
VFTEDMTAGQVPRHGYARDAVEVEEYARDFGRRRRDVALTIFRFANFMGSEIETPLTRYFALPAVPSALGYDPRIQFVHESDAVEVLRRATLEEHPGIFNVTGDGVLLLSQAIRLCGKLPMKVPLPMASTLANLARRLRLMDFPTDQIPFLVYGRVADNERLKRRFGFPPRYTTRQALEEFVSGQRFRRWVTPEQAAEWEREAYAFLSRRRGPRRREVRP